MALQNVPDRAVAATYTSTPSFDPDKYRIYLEDSELTEDQQREYLEILWSIMMTFVELGFGLDSVQQALVVSDEADCRPE